VHAVECIHSADQVSAPVEVDGDQVGDVVTDALARAQPLNQRPIGVHLVGVRRQRQRVGGDPVARKRGALAGPRFGRQLATSCEAFVSCAGFENAYGVSSVIFLYAEVVPRGGAGVVLGAKDDALRARCTARTARTRSRGRWPVWSGGQLRLVRNQASTSRGITITAVMTTGHIKQA
jgi:hypothetical protein